MLESWITPSLFAENGVADGLGEWEFCAQIGPTNCSRVLSAHWNSWVQESDIAALAAAGITHVRIPVGYWIVDIQPGEPFVTGGWDVLVTFLEKLKNYNIQVGRDVSARQHTPERARVSVGGDRPPRRAGFPKRRRQLRPLHERHPLEHASEH